MSTRFNKLPPKSEYIVAVNAALERSDESSIRDISRQTGLSHDQSLSALDYLVRMGEVEVRRQNRTPTALYRLSIRTSGQKTNILVKRQALLREEDSLEPTYVQGEVDEPNAYQK